MRDIYEYKKEIFARSEKRINKRKQRTKIFSIVCIPFVLFSVFFSIYVLPALQSKDKAAPERSDIDEYTEYESETTHNESNVIAVEVYTEIAYSQNGEKKIVRISESETAAWLLEQFDNVFITDGGSETEQSDDNAEGENVGASQIVGENVSYYEISFYGIDGKDKEYILTGNVLKAADNSKQVVVDNAFIEKLKTYLRDTVETDELQ